MTELHHRSDPESPEELSLLDIIIVLLKYKRMILLFVIITVLGGLGLLYLYSQRSPSRSVSDIFLSSGEGLYYSECLIGAEGDFLERINLLIYRRNFVFQVIQENDLETDIQKAIQAVEKEKSSAREAAPRPEIYRWVRANLFATVSGSVLTLGFAAPQQDLPPKMISAFLNSLSDFFRKLDLDRTAAQQKALRRNLAEAREPFLKARISEEIVKLMENEARARNEKYYRFELLDPPLIVEKVRILRRGNDKKLESLEDWVSVSLPRSSGGAAKDSRYGMVVFLLFLASLVVAVSLAFFLDSIEKTRQRSPEKLARLKKYLSLRQK